MTTYVCVKGKYNTPNLRLGHLDLSDIFISTTIDFRATCLQNPIFKILSWHIKLVPVKTTLQALNLKITFPNMIGFILKKALGIET